MWVNDSDIHAISTQEVHVPNLSNTFLLQWTHSNEKSNLKIKVTYKLFAMTIEQWIIKWWSCCLIWHFFLNLFQFSTQVIEFTQFHLFDFQKTKLFVSQENQLVPEQKILKDKSISLVSNSGNLDIPLSDLNDLFFEVIQPKDVSYAFKIRLAREFGSSFVSSWIRFSPRRKFIWLFCFYYS